MPCRTKWKERRMPKMSKYAVDMVDIYTRETIERDEYDTEEEAQIALNEYLENFAAGAETLELAGRDYIDPDDVDFELVEL